MGLFTKKHSIGKTIAALRKEKGWTQVELAEKLQVSDKAVSKWEKDDAFPSIEFFPALAKLFDVSIDYLMTGKETEPEIITMSKIELCAKNDDPSMIKNIDLTTKDENGKTIIDYVIQYESYNVFSVICDKKEFVNLQNYHNRNGKKFDISTLIKFALITNKVVDLGEVIFSMFNISNSILHSKAKKDSIKSLFHKNDKANYMTNKEFFCLTDDVLDTIILDKRVSDDTINFLLDKQHGSSCVWYQIFPYLLHQSYVHENMDMFNRILNISVLNNQYAYDNYDGHNYVLSSFMISRQSYEFRTTYPYFECKIHGLVRILEETIKLALERSDIDTVEKLNKLNKDIMNYHSGFGCYIASADEIRIAKLKLDKSITKEELAIQSAIHEGVLYIDELLALNDFKAIKKALNEFPIHIIEILYSLFIKKEWRKLFEYAVDNNNSSLANEIIKSNEESIAKCLSSYWKENINKKHLFYMDNGRKIELFARPYGNIQYTTIEDAINKLQLCKQRILDELSLKIDKDKIVGELTKEYFESELLKGNEDIVIIKLCVRLEAILRCVYHYNGDFSTMLNQYCNEKLHWSEDDGWGYTVNKSDDKTIKLLNNLRIKRNSIVHSEKSNVALSKEDILYCIEYICKLG